MTVRFNWRGAFYGTNVDIGSAERRLVRQEIADWNGEWQWDTDDGYIIRLEDENCDGIWDLDYDDSDDVDAYLPTDFVRYLDKKFLGTTQKTTLIVGKATKLPLPGAHPSHS